MYYIFSNSNIKYNSMRKK